MSYKVFLSNKAGRQYKKLNSHIRDKIKSNLDGLRQHPHKAFRGGRWFREQLKAIVFSPESTAKQKVEKKRIRTGSHLTYLLRFLYSTLNHRNYGKMHCPMLTESAPCSLGTWNNRSLLK
jgi:mRNA-degrading endonuclease RelE of RelBE toxin-antitoxin system